MSTHIYSLQLRKIGDNHLHEAIAVKGLARVRLLYQVFKDAHDVAKDDLINVPGSGGRDVRLQ